MAESKKNTKAFYKGFIPEDWSTPEFGHAFSFLKTFSFSRKQLSNTETIDGIRNIHYGDIHATFENKILDFEIEKRVPYLIDGLIDKNLFKDDNFPALQDGDLLIADASEDYEGICDCVELKNINEKKVTGGLHTFAARSSNDKIALGFKTLVLSHQQVIRQLRRIATGISVYGVSKTNLSKLKIPLPPLSEQKAIAQLLSTWDAAISKNKQQTAQKELRKKWLMQNLLTGKQRVDSFVDTYQMHKTKLGILPVDWNLHFLSNLLSPTGRQLKPKGDVFYQQIGIRSHTKGIFYKEKVSGTTLGNKRVFWIEPDCFIVNIVFAWEHAIAKTTNKELGTIASHRFPMYKSKSEILDLDYLLYYFKSPRGKYLLGLASPGGAGRNKTLGKAEFMKLKIPVPSLQEQKSIVQVLGAADKEIKLLKSKTEKLKEQKRGLMQVLLTGRKRLKI